MSGSGQEIRFVNITRDDDVGGTTREGGFLGPKVVRGAVSFN